MKVVALGKISQNKFCNLSPGTVFSFLNSSLEVEEGIYMKLKVAEAKQHSSCVDLKTGEIRTQASFHTSQRCKIWEDACIVLDPIDRD